MLRSRNGANRHGNMVRKYFVKNERQLRQVRINIQKQIYVKQFVKWGFVCMVFILKHVLIVIHTLMTLQFFQTKQKMRFIEVQMIE